MNILYVNHLSEVSGAEKVLIDILAKIDKKKFTPFVACPKSGKLVNEINLLGIKIVSIKTSVLKRTFNPLLLIIFIFYALITTIKLTYFIKSKSIKLIHANSFTACLFCSIPGKISGVPILWYMHDLVTPRLFNKIFIGYAGLMASRVIATTRAMKENLILLGVNPEKIIVNYLGIDLEKYNSANRKKVREEYGISNVTPLIGIIGQVTAWKGHTDFLKAASIVGKKYPLAKFMIVGEETISGNKNYDIELKKLTKKLSLSDKVIFTGFRKDTPDVMASLDILVNASWSEPFGLVIIEAMALGKPVIATNAGGVPEIIEDGVHGILIPPKNSEKLAAAILKILDEPIIGKIIGEAGLKRVNTRFSLERYTKENQEIYGQILGES